MRSRLDSLNSDEGLQMRDDLVEVAEPNIGPQICELLVLLQHVQILWIRKILHVLDFKWSILGIRFTPT